MCHRWRKCPDSSERWFWVNPRQDVASPPHCSWFLMYMLLWLSFSKRVSFLQETIPRCILRATPFLLFIFRLIFKAILRFWPVFKKTLLMAVFHSCVLYQLSNLWLFAIFVHKKEVWGNLRLLQLLFGAGDCVFTLRSWFQTVGWFCWAVILLSWGSEMHWSSLLHGCDFPPMERPVWCAALKAGTALACPPNSALPPP